jgi:SPP1 gp7 family putative phage head morphogenesis protein
MTPQQLSELFREFLIRAEKRSAFLLLSEFDKLRDEISQFLIENGVQMKDLDEILSHIEDAIARRTIRLAQSVTNAQRYVVKAAAKTIGAYLNTPKGSIFEPDLEATQKLIGRTQNNSTLARFFNRLKEPIREAAKEQLIEGFSKGESAGQIAKRMNDVADVGKARALTIARTETNEAYRAASREFLRQADIKKYVWMAVLDARTCVICWSLHGRLFDSDKKVFSHPNCRCTLIPVTKGMKPVETGTEKFAKLQPGFQKQILGQKRFDLYTSGSELSSFVGSKEDAEFGRRHFIRPLSDLSGD